ncbi:hypothetical protein CPC08DRAFT_168196 [Agrocybe pediades]|nr:hypothetical protein CPC08DRAFT_168196 [Agrocybe pediades]
MSVTVLPPYSSCALSTNAAGTSDSSSLPPTYSTAPSDGEETVAFTPRAGATNPTGTFKRDWPQATLILKDQEEGTRLPTYGRGGRVIGELGVKNLETVSRVTVKLFGQMNLSVADSGSASVILVSESRILWKQLQNDQTGATSEQKCPSLLPIHIPIPQTYELHGKLWRLPPSYEATFLGIPALFVRCLYTLSITVTRTRSYRLASWTTSKTYVTMLNYRPRTRPHRPIIMLDSVFASIKPVPDDWQQLMTNMHSRPKSGMKHIECHTFALTEVIPFHLQLCSSLASLQELLPPSSPQLKLRNSKWGDCLQKDHSIRVYIVRQVLVEINGRRRFRTFTIGSSKMWPVPPVVHNGASSHGTWKDYDSASGEAGADTDDICLDWQGEVKCWPEVNSGGFSVGNLVVKDFLILALVPPNPRSCSLIPLQLSHAIRLVTDSWVDVDSLHPGDT